MYIMHENVSYYFNVLYMLNYHQHICKGLLFAKTQDADYEKVTANTVARGLVRHQTYRHSSVISADILIF